MSNWMIDWLRAWEKATRPADIDYRKWRERMLGQMVLENQHRMLGSLVNCSFDSEGYLHSDPIPAGADPLWQPTYYAPIGNGYCVWTADSISCLTPEIDPVPPGADPVWQPRWYYSPFAPPVCCSHPAGLIMQSLEPIPARVYLS